MKIWDLLCIILLAVSLMLRLYLFDYPLINGEAQRDYIVAQHIVSYKEVPLTGPCCLWNGTFGIIRNAPTYYYFLAAILWLKNDILFLNFINIFLQVGTVGIVYLLAKKLFNHSSALIAALLFSLTNEVIKQSLFVWQPHIMQPFVNLSYLLLLFAYLKKSFTLVVFSIFFFFFAGALHNSAYGVIPAFSLFVFLIIKIKKWPLSYYFWALVAAVVSLILFYLPWFIHLTKNSFTFPVVYATFAGFLVQSLPEALFRLSQAMLVLMRGFSLNNFFAFGILIGLILYFFRKKDWQKKMPLIFLVGAILQFVIIASFFKSAIWAYYFTPIFGLLLIGIAEVANSLLSRNILSNLIKVVVIIVLIKVFSFDFYYLKKGLPLTNMQHIQAATKAIKNELAFIGFNSFRIKVYARDIESPITADLVFWAPLEKTLSTKFLTIVDEGNSYKIINGNSYIFVVCQSYLYTIEVERRCLNPFSQEYRGYSITKNIYSHKPFVIYLAKRSV